MGGRQTTTSCQHLQNTATLSPPITISPQIVRIPPRVLKFLFQNLQSSPQPLQASSFHLHSLLLRASFVPLIANHLVPTHLSTKLHHIHHHSQSSASSSFSEKRAKATRYVHHIHLFLFSSPLQSAPQLNIPLSFLPKAKTIRFTCITNFFQVSSW